MKSRVTRDPRVAPGEVVPSTDLVMEHMHPDDVATAWGPATGRQPLVARGRPQYATA